MTTQASSRALPRVAPLFLAFHLLGSAAQAQQTHFTLTGNSPGDLFGSVLRSAGDVNGDGASDYLVRSIEQLTVVSGASQQVLYSLTGGDGYARSFDRLDDVNGDGYDDFVVSEVPSGSVSYFGVVYVYSGFDASVLYTLDAMGADADIFGSVVRSCTDLDQDGVRDLLTQRRVFRNQTQQNVIAYSGATGAELFSIVSSGSSSGFAETFADLGDVNGDGVGDFAVGDDNYFVSSGSSGTGFSIRGRARIYSGASQAVLYDVEGNHLSYGFPDLLTPLGDLDGDGAGELLISSEESSSGIVRVHSGDDGSLLHEFSNPHGGDYFGRVTNNAGDVDGDGTEDIIIGAPGDLPFLVAAGAAYVYSGADFDLLFSVEAEEILQGLGAAVLAAGDVNGDGLGDVLIGRPLRFNSATPGEVLGMGLGLSPIEIGFELGDDFQTGIENGREVEPGELFGRLLRIFSSESGHYGVTAFDSASNGPNANGPAPEFLVDQGNLLMLQANSGQSAAGLFDIPQPAAQGGTLRFEWLAPVTPLSIDMVSLAKQGEATRVRLIDRSGRTRTYMLPSGFTADAVLIPGEAVQTLDLTTLDPQQGYLAAATATQNPGFSPQNVTGMEIVLPAAGAVDRLRFLPSGQPQVPRIATYLSTPEPADSNFFARDFGRAGDVDLDGKEDYLVTVFATGGDRVDLYSGVDGQLLHSFESPANGAAYGDSVRGVGDVDADGYPDIGIGSWLLDRPGANNAGGAFLYSGRTFETIVEHYGQAGEELGVELGPMGDVDADGHDDYLVGSRSFDGFRGRIQVLSGATHQPLLTIEGEQPGDYLGTDAQCVGDTDGDGVADLLVRQDGVQGAGRLSIRSGADGRILFERSGEFSFQLLGAGSAPAGDVNQDGRADFLFVDSSWRDATGAFLGRLQVRSGGDWAVIHELIGQNPGGQFAWPSSPAGDQDGDGVPDFALIETIDDPVLPTTVRRLRVVSGRTAATLYQRVFPAGTGANRLQPAGDLSGDGIDELLVSTFILGGEEEVQALTVRRANASVVCTGADNTTGKGARLYANGGFAAADNNLELTAVNLPPKALALLISSPAFAREGLPFISGSPSSGSLCLLRVPTTRHGFAVSNGGSATFSVDLATLPGALPNTSALVGTTELFQCIYRDFGAPGDTNLSDAIRFQFE